MLVHGALRGHPRLLCNGDENRGTNTNMRIAILGIASAAVFISPALADGSYSQAPTYNREVHIYEQRRAPPVAVYEQAPVVRDTIVVRRPVVVAPPRVVYEDYPVYAAPRVYSGPPVYAYGGPVYRERGHAHFRHGHHGHRGHHARGHRGHGGRW
jgi:hypothetical protein